jgi:hypothetical protein
MYRPKHCPPLTPDCRRQGLPKTCRRGIVTFASFTCQQRGTLEDRMEENQRFREPAIVANPPENRLFLASVTIPPQGEQPSTSAVRPKRPIAGSITVLPRSQLRGANNGLLPCGETSTFDLKAVVRSGRITGRHWPKNEPAAREGASCEGQVNSGRLGVG